MKISFSFCTLIRVAGNAAYVLGALLDNDVGRKKVVLLLRDEDQSLETQRCLPNLGALIETFDLEAMTNASGTASLIVSNLGIVAKFSF